VSVDHYENFPVASWLCPAALRPAVAALYGYARTADDLADEGDAVPAERLGDLAAYRADLLAVAAGKAPSARWQPVFEALGRALREHHLPIEPLLDLLDAFAQDVTVQRYANRAELLDYCRRSAHPIGRLLLHLYGVRGAAALRQTDAICCALQLAHFWQDLGADARRGRLYLPLADCAAHGVAADAVLAGRDSPQLRKLVWSMVGWARATMLAGAPLVHAVPGRAGWELRLVVQGGLRILEKVDALNGATLQQRPTLGWRDAAPLAWRALTMHRGPMAATPEAA
jgi:squalene synthase HpnC